MGSAYRSARFAWLTPRIPLALPHEGLQFRNAGLGILPEAPVGASERRGVCSAQLVCEVDDFRKTRFGGLLQEAQFGRGDEKPFFDEGERTARQEFLSCMVDDIVRVQAPFGFWNQQMEGRVQRMPGAQGEDFGVGRAVSRRADACRFGPGQAKGADGPPVLKCAPVADNEFHRVSLTCFLNWDNNSFTALDSRWSHAGFSLEDASDSRGSVEPIPWFPTIARCSSGKATRRRLIRM